MNTALRWWRHFWLDAGDARRCLTDAGLQRLEQRVAASESRHRGELRVCIEGGWPPALLWQGLSARARAVDLFGQLRVWDTEHNNGVLIYLLLAERRIEILADRGLHQRVPVTTWNTLVAGLQQHLAQGRHEAGLNDAIDQVGALLREHFPACPHGDVNPDELPNAVVLL